MTNGEQNWPFAITQGLHKKQALRQRGELANRIGNYHDPVTAHTKLFGLKLVRSVSNCQYRVIIY